MSLTLRCTRAGRFRPSWAEKVLQKALLHACLMASPGKRFAVVDIVGSCSAGKRLRGRYSAVTDRSASMGWQCLDVFCLSCL